MNEDKAREASALVDSLTKYANEFRSNQKALVYVRLTLDEVERLISALQWAASQQAAEGDDELLRLRAKVDALTREAWTWSKACESESMRIHGMKDAINKAYGIVSKEHPWTPEHSKNYPQQAANIINAAMTIFAPPSTQGGADE